MTDFPSSRRPPPAPRHQAKLCRAAGQSAPSRAAGGADLAHQPLADGAQHRAAADPRHAARGHALCGQADHRRSGAADAACPRRRRFGDWWESGALSGHPAFLAIEFLLVIATDLLTRATSLVDSVLGEMHSNTISIELMQHAAKLDLLHFESAEYQDRLERARRQAAGRNALLGANASARRRTSSRSSRWRRGCSSMRPG